MKIATYNIWNSNRGMPERENQIIQEIRNLDSDIIALQEVKSKDFAQELYEKVQYEHYKFEAHEGYNEGLAVYSKYPILSSLYSGCALILVIEVEGHKVLLANLHLPWDSALQKEECIVKIIHEVKNIECDSSFILGDFNCSESSSVHHYLMGERTLNGTEVNAYWTDLAIIAEEFLDVPREMTLNIKTNPRWKDAPLTDHSSRVDCIFMHASYPKPSPSLKNFGYFGKSVSEKSGMCASDHYGVYAELNMP